MKKRHFLLGTGVCLVLTTGCKSDEAAPEDDLLPAIQDMELVTPAEAAELARAQISEANVDAEFAKLVAELEAASR